MKKIYSLISALFVTFVIQAQIPNSSFENWTNGLPTGWYGVNSPDTLFVKSSNAYTGNSALRMNVAGGGIPYGGYIFTGDSGTNANVPISALPQALYGWYISNPVDSGDQLLINSNSTSGAYIVGIIGSGITEATSVYKQFIFNYSGYTEGTGPDSIEIEFGIQNQTSNMLSPSTYFIIDDLSFGPAVTAITPVNDAALLEQCSPNPARNTTNIIYSLTGHSTVSVGLYDMLGHKVKTLLDNTEQTQGRYKIPTDISELAEGIYFYCLNVDGQTYTQKLVVSK